MKSIRVLRELRPKTSAQTVTTLTPDLLDLEERTCAESARLVLTPSRTLRAACHVLPVISAMEARTRTHQPTSQFTRVIFVPRALTAPKEAMSLFFASQARSTNTSEANPLRTVLYAQPRLLSRFGDKKAATLAVSSQMQFLAQNNALVSERTEFTRQSTIHAAAERALTSRMLMASLKALHRTQRTVFLMCWPVAMGPTKSAPQPVNASSLTTARTNAVERMENVTLCSAFALVRVSRQPMNFAIRNAEQMLQLKGSLETQLLSSHWPALMEV